MVSITEGVGAEGNDDRPVDVEELRRRLQLRADRRRLQLEKAVSELAEARGVPTIKQFLDSIELLRRVNPNAASTAEYHYLARASLRSIALATGCSQTECLAVLSTARAWLTRATKA